METWAAASESLVLEKLATTRRAISEWNRLQQRNSGTLIDQLKQQLEEALTSPMDDTVLIQGINDKLGEAYLAEEAFWKQLNRLLWLQLEDRNTGFFHATTKNRKRANAFTVMEDTDGKLVYKEAEIATTVVEYFKNLYTSVEGTRGDTVQYALDQIITQEDNETLIQIPSESEIKAAVFAVKGEKAPGPDWFSASFYHTH